MQVMRLLRHLDNLFEASYNQLFKLTVTNFGLTAWTTWVENELPKLMPYGVVLAQNTPHVFQLYRQAAEVKSFYDQVFRRLARETNAEWQPSPLKKMFRILEKADQLHHGDFDCSKIFDVVRGTLVYKRMDDRPGGVLMGVQALFACSRFQVVRVKDRFNNPTSACWRDVLINGRLVARDGSIYSHIVEVQFHQKDLRRERTMVGGHFMYERHRALFEACEQACGSEQASATLKRLHSASRHLLSPEDV